ncbi:ribonuclease H family protein, partial [Ascidiaceihabitans sp.]|nr:ribonuclease H family protein [Ascidiaceihabitans sp.]
MSGETNLDELIRSLSAVLVEGLYVFATVKAPQDLMGIVPRMTFGEAEGTT